MQNEQIVIQNLLNKSLMDLKTKNPSYSIRAFAKKLDIQPSALSEILRGKRRVSRKKAEQFADKLFLDPTEKSLLLNHFPKKVERSSKYKSNRKKIEIDSFLKLTSDQFAMISNGLHFSILSLIQTNDFKSDLNWISKRLDKTPNQISQALRRLESLNLIKVENKTIKRTAAPITIDDDVLNLSVQKSHIEDMETAKEKITKIDVKKRDYTSLTLPGDPELLPKAKEIIRNAQLQIEELMENGRNQEVYKLSVYLYPLTNELTGA